MSLPLDTDRLSQPELIEYISRAFARMDPKDFLQSQLSALFYKMEPSLPRVVAEVLALPARANKVEDRQKRGDLLEAVSVVLFAGVTCLEDLESTRDPMGQHDLLFRASGTQGGEQIARCLFGTRFDGLVECKATAGPVGIGTMGRLCAMLELHFEKTTALGVFLALNGISGAGAQKVGDAQLASMLFYAKYGKPILVIDRDDLAQLAAGANLIDMLRSKITALERGRPLLDTSARKEAAKPLPDRLQAVFDQCSIAGRKRSRAPASSTGS